MPNFEEINGIQYGAGVKTVIYGQEGVGKTTLAAAFPGAVFIDCEGSTSKMNVRRLPKPTSWQMLCDEMMFVLQSHTEKQYRTVIVDTFDWAERLCIDELCTEHKVNGIEGFGYGKGWQYEAEKIGRFLDLTEQLITAGINVVLLCHAVTKKTTLPEEMEEFDHWELKLGSKTTNKIAPLLKEWSDMTLFLAFHTNVIAVDDKGKKHKATSAERVMYTTKSAWWDAKNRFGLAERLPLDFGSIAHIFTPPTFAEGVGRKMPAGAPPPQQMIVQAQQQDIPVHETPSQNLPPAFDDPSSFEPIGTGGENPTLDGIPPKLADLMRANNVSPAHIQYVCSQVRNYFPADMPLRDYPQDFVNGVLIAAWSQVFDMIQKNCPDYVPF
ncbi:MAG: ATP-binding protein [Oscillospiraceae bacterium]|nr:ATP-binding protein [Oscillospiraceae bacterium]